MSDIGLPVAATARRAFLLLAAVGLFSMFASHVRAAGSDAAGLSGTDWATLRAQLAYYGWQVQRSADGSLLLRPPGNSAGAAARPAATKAPEIARSSVRPIEFEALREMLEPHGWVVRRDADGSLLLYSRVEVDTPPRVASAEVQPAAGGTADMGRLQALLEGGGWQVERSADGSLLLRPPESAAAGKPAAAAGRSLQAQTPDSTPQLGYDALRDNLQRHGWRVRRDPDGSLRLLVETGGTESKEAAPVAHRDRMQDLRARLKGTGWKVETDAQGALILRLSDGDADGVPDRRDVCLDTPPHVRVNLWGCDRTRPRVLDGVAFRFSSAELTEDSKSILDREVAILRNYPGLALLIVGHTDALGPPEFNLALSDKRAAAVKAYLVEQGLDPGRFRSEGRGASEPVATNATRLGRARNRRVEFIPLGQ